MGDLEDGRNQTAFSRDYSPSKLDSIQLEELIIPVVPGQHPAKALVPGRPPTPNADDSIGEAEDSEEQEYHKVPVETEQVGLGSPSSGRPLISLEDTALDQSGFVPIKRTFLRFHLLVGSFISNWPTLTIRTLIFCGSMIIQMSLIGLCYWYT